MTFPQHAPVAVGGVGGSGTRVVATILRELGFYLGSDLNTAGDNLWYTLLFVRPNMVDEPSAEVARRVRLFVNAMTRTGSVSHSDLGWLMTLANEPVPHGRMCQTSWLQERAERLIEATRRDGGPAVNWGWKEPNTHIILDRLHPLLPTMRYVHVARNGLDMAISRNQQQLTLWGPALLDSPDFAIDPRHSLKYWCHVHRRVLAIGEQMAERFLFLRFEDLCLAPERELSRFARFLGLEVEASLVARLTRLVVPPKSIGRFRTEAAGPFDPEDVEYVARLGFETSGS